MDDDTISELVDLLRRRAELLASLGEGSREKRDLVEAHDLPRSTLDRAIRELEAADLVEYADGTYALTAVGAHLVGEFDAFVERAEQAVELEPFLRWTTPETFDLDLRSLTDAEVWTPEPGDPWAMVNRHVSALETADRVRGVLPLVGLHAVETVHERVTGDGADHRFVVDASAAETLRTDENYLPLFRDLQARPEPTFLRDDREAIPYFVGVFDDEFVQIGVDEDGDPRALLESDSEEVLTWACDRIERYRARAEPVPDADGHDSGR
ncbi:helix-turn-helix transcriptional regulator [Halosimplex amylolyticum]|uniref:helix-turn-helix transcriptional regulator n=1 Tax=Halosimplex amylolyticum TaxID=3396616 RepID=UPI003F545A28